MTIDNAPLAFLQDYCDPVRCQRDPVMQHCRRHGLPIAWGQSLYLQSDAMDLWETQAQFGYRHRVAVALHLPHGRHFMVGVDRDQPLPRNPVELARTTADLHMFTAHAQEAALRLFDDGQGKIEFKNLSRRELEALRWTLEGKTAHEVGAVLGIAERTANLHLRNGMKKLACSSKHQAALKALRLGLIY